MLTNEEIKWILEVKKWNKTSREMITNSKSSLIQMITKQFGNDSLRIFDTIDRLILIIEQGIGQPITDELLDTLKLLSRKGKF